MMPNVDPKNRLEYDSWLETVCLNFTTALGCLATLGFACLGMCLVMGLLGWIYGEDASGFTQPIPELILASTGLAGLALVAICIRSAIDIHYYLDHELQELLLYRKIFRWSGIKSVARFSDLHCLTVGGKFVSESQGKGKPSKEYWMTALFLVTQQGQQIRVSDFLKHGTWDPSQNCLAQNLGIPFVDCHTSHKRLIVRCRKDGVEVSHGPPRSALVGCLWIAGITLALSVLWSVYGSH